MDKIYVFKDGLIRLLPVTVQKSVIHEVFGPTKHWSASSLLTANIFMESIPEPKCCCLQHYFSEILICIHVFYKPMEETSDFIWPTVTIVLEGRLYKHLVDLKCSICDRKRVFFHFALWYKVLQFLDWIDNFLTLDEQEELISASALLSSQRHTFTGIADGRVQEGKQFFFFLFYFTGFLVKKKENKALNSNL